jgi:hypothetical protein
MPSLGACLLWRQRRFQTLPIPNRQKFYIENVVRELFRRCEISESSVAFAGKNGLSR